MPSPAEILIPTAFGLEAVVARELDALGYTNRTVENGRVRLRADLSALCRLNLHLRSGERVLLKVGEFPAADFDALFDQTTALPWSDWLPVDAAFPVLGKSVRSQLTHVPSCQSVLKKAVVESLSRRYGRQRFPETGPVVPIEFSLVEDRLLLALNSSGAGLHKRGYRVRGGKAPLKETLAAGLVQLSHWHPQRPFRDPFCGTGTLAIEAALLGRHIAPGLLRSFAAEDWPWLPTRWWKEARTEARERQLPGLPERLIATDISRSAVRSARENALAAGVSDDIHFQQKPAESVSSQKRFGCLLANPPYGKRLSNEEELSDLYATLQRLMVRLPDWSFFLFSAERQLEKRLSRRATRRRKLYNGPLECTYFQFHGPKPPALRHDRTARYSSGQPGRTD